MRTTVQKDDDDDDDDDEEEIPNWIVNHNRFRLFDVKYHGKALQFTWEGVRNTRFGWVPTHGTSFDMQRLVVNLHALKDYIAKKKEESDGLVFEKAKKDQLEERNIMKHKHRAPENDEEEDEEDEEGRTPENRRKLSAMFQYLDLFGE